MKKIMAILSALLFVLASPSFAAVGIMKDGVLQGTAADLDFPGGSPLVTGGKAQFRFVVSGIDKDGSTSVASGTADISDTGYSMIFKDIPATVQSGTLANGVAGQIIVIQIGADSGGEYRMTATTRTGWTTLHFNDQDDRATLLYINDTRGWLVLTTDSVDLF